MLLCDLGETRKPGTLPLFLYRIVSRADREGRRVANGIYFYRLDTPDYRNFTTRLSLSGPPARRTKYTPAARRLTSFAPE